MSFLVPRTRFGIDNVEISWSAPYEDEFAIAMMCQLSPYVTMALPHKHDFYDRFLTLGDASADEISQWKSALTTFLKKLTFKYHRPLILKSPAHTCRIKYLLELFPSARFVHIYRNPFDVFQSTRKMLASTLRFWKLQDAACVDWDDRTIEQYREMYDLYFEERQLIQSGHLHELSFEDLEANPVDQVRKLYRALALPEFEQFEVKLTKYVASLSGYRKNTIGTLRDDMRERIAREWLPCFDAWGYATSAGEPNPSIRAT